MKQPGLTVFRVNEILRQSAEVADAHRLTVAERERLQSIEFASIEWKKHVQAMRQMENELKNRKMEGPVFPSPYPRNILPPRDEHEKEHREMYFKKRNNCDAMFYESVRQGLAERALEQYFFAESVLYGTIGLQIAWPWPQVNLPPARAALNSEIQRLVGTRIASLASILLLRQRRSMENEALRGIHGNGMVAKRVALPTDDLDAYEDPWKW